jgi:hypothetical protein
MEAQAPKLIDIQLHRQAKSHSEALRFIVQGQSGPASLRSDDYWNCAALSAVTRVVPVSTSGSTGSPSR